MRKRLLRSRSGFEKPESREEAIMQNILGASNVLEPSESNIEEILKSILYNTPYTKEAEFEIEKILLAIKNNGTYDGEVESRDMKILLAILRDSNYTEEPESRIEELFIEWLQQRQQIKVLEGVPPLPFTARGLPLINYLIEGNTVQNGTPTQQNPVMPQGTGERTVNLFDKNNVENILVSTSGVETANNNYILSTFIPVDNMVTIFATKLLTDPIRIIRYDVNKQFISRTDENNANNIVVDDCAYVRINANKDHWDIGTIQAEHGTKTSYEPYGVKIPISSANTTTPVYLGEVQTTRKIKKLVLTGEEGWTITSNGVMRIGLSGQLRPQTPICTHYIGSNASAWGSVPDGAVTVSISGYLAVYDSTYTDITTFKTYLQQQYSAGTPVTVWYVLATEETAVVNEPLMKIGSYADSISMEQTGIEIPTINGSNTFDVDTTVKPSNVYIEYK